MAIKIVIALLSYLFYWFCCFLGIGTDKKNLVGLRSYLDNIRQAVRKHKTCGKRTKEVLLVLTERKTREQIIGKIKSKSQYCVVKELDKTERKLGSRKFREKFKTITCDNGCENPDFEGVERSALTKGKRNLV